MTYNKYHKRFLNSKSSECIISAFTKSSKPYKEITESWGMLECAKKFVTDVSEMKVIVVGDGCTPRTGLLFAYFTKADVISVDCNFNMDFWEMYCNRRKVIGNEVKRLTVINDKIENIEIDCDNKPCLILWVHSHADMNKIRLKNTFKRVDINMPCCVPIPRNWLEIPHISFVDYDVLSPKNTIYVWGCSIQPYRSSLYPIERR